MNLVLIGYRGTGKSTVARCLAQRLQWEWVDADQQVERRAGVSIKEIFEAFGEERFRDLEAELIEELSRADRLIIACGGGAVLREENRRRLAERGRIIWLRASAEAIYRRIQSDPQTANRRPNLTAAGGYEEIEALLDQRRPLYQQCAEFQIDTEEKTPQQIADEIVSLTIPDHS